MPGASIVVPRSVIQDREYRPWACVQSQQQSQSEAECQETACRLVQRCSSRMAGACLPDLVRVARSATRTGQRRLFCRVMADCRAPSASASRRRVYISQSRWQSPVDGRGPALKPPHRLSERAERRHGSPASGAGGEMVAPSQPPNVSAPGCSRSQKVNMTPVNEPGQRVIASPGPVGRASRSPAPSAAEYQGPGRTAPVSINSTTAAAAGRIYRRCRR